MVSEFPVTTPAKYIIPTRRAADRHRPPLTVGSRCRESKLLELSDGARRLRLTSSPPRDHESPYAEWPLHRLHSNSGSDLRKPGPGPATRRPGLSVTERHPVTCRGATGKRYTRGGRR
eukprot:749586-Hanusia_phi.AAC.3